MPRGTIKKLTDKGFGFIKRADGDDVFFHKSSLKNGSFDSLREGADVSFEIGSGPKGPRAENVRVL